MSAEAAIRLTEILLAIAFLQKSVEHVFGLPDERLYFLPLAALSLLLLTGIESDLVCYALLVNALFILHRFQGPYNGGSDLLGYLILVCLCLAHAAPDPRWREYALAYLALQPILSYFKSGWSKAIHRDWWSGQALRDVFDFSAYPVSDAIRARFRDSALLAPMSWAVILFELAFPLALLHRDALVAALALAAAFHLANFLLFGFNRFVWIWVASYPAILWLQDRLVGAGVPVISG
ncbi:MAG: HTTM domain-containing protein [Thalassobaculum sp.]|jgi:hypothetical protein